MRLSFGNARDRCQAFDARWKNGRCRAPAERLFYTSRSQQELGASIHFLMGAPEGLPQTKGSAAEVRGGYQT
jgi:hypothetical protein